MVSEICHPPGRERCLGALRTQRSNLRPSACYASEAEDSPWQPLACRFGSERDRTAQKRWGRENVQGESLKESHLTSPCSCHQILYSLRKACHAAGPSGCFCPPSFLLGNLKQQELIQRTVCLRSVPYKQHFGMQKVLRWVRQGPCLPKR